MTIISCPFKLTTYAFWQSREIATPKLKYGTSKLWLRIPDEISNCDINPATYSTIDRDPLGTGPITAPAQNVVMGLESGNTLFFTDALHGWKVDNTGAILRTLDGGHSWVDSYSGPYSVDGLDFINSSVGWATLSSPLDPNSSYTTETINPNNIELIYTTDGGQS